MERPLVSVIIPAYNAEKYIRNTVGTVLSQTYPNVEVIVVNDGSTDKTLEVLTSIKGIVILDQHNQGPSVARNAGIHRATGEYVAFLDADDAWHPDKLTEQMNGIHQHNASWSVCGFLDHRSRKRSIVLPDTPTQRYNFFTLLLKGLEMNMCTVVVNRSLLFKHSIFFTPKVNNSEDTEFWLRIAIADPTIVYVGKPLVDYLHPNPESLTRLSFKNTDTHFATVESRLQEYIKQLSQDNRAKLLSYLKIKTRKRALRQWIMTPDATAIRQILFGRMSSMERFLIKLTSNFPYIFRRMYVYLIYKF